MRYSGLKGITEGLFGNKGWTPAWRDPAPKAEYDVIIIGGGGHGLSTAYYLAKNHGITNVAVLEKGYLGSGNIGRNTTIVRANYFLPGNSEFYSHSLKLWEGLEADLNYNVMHSQRGLINLFHSDGQRDAFVRRGNAMINQGDDAVLLDRDGVVRAALDRRVVADHHALPAADPADPGDDPGRGDGVGVVGPGPVHPGRGQGAQLEERAAGVEQPVDPVTDQQLAAAEVLVARRLRTAPTDDGEAFAELGDQLGQSR